MIASEACLALTSLYIILHHSPPSGVCIAAKDGGAWDEQFDIKLTSNTYRLPPPCEIHRFEAPKKLQFSIPSSR